MLSVPLCVWYVHVAEEAEKNTALAHRPNCVASQTEHLAPIKKKTTKWKCISQNGMGANDERRRRCTTAKFSYKNGIAIDTYIIHTFIPRPPAQHERYIISFVFFFSSLFVYTFHLYATMHMVLYYIYGCRHLLVVHAITFVHTWPPMQTHALTFANCIPQSPIENVIMETEYEIRTEQNRNGSNAKKGRDGFVLKLHILHNGP